MHRQYVHLLLILSLCCLLRANLEINSIIPTTAVIAATTSYAFNMIRFNTMSPLPGNGVIEIDFPSQYNSLLPVTPQCTSSQFSSEMTCSYSLGILLINNALTNSSQLNPSIFTITVSGITNPIPATTYGSFLIRIRQLDNTIAEQSSQTSTVTTTAGSAICSLSLSNGYVFKRGTIVLSYESQLAANSSNAVSLSLSMSQFYSDDGTRTDIAASCPQATSQPGSYIFVLPFSTSVTISLLMPPSTMGASNFIHLQAYDSLGVYDQCSLSITGVLPNTFTELSVSQVTVQLNSFLQFTLISTTPIQSTDSLIIVLDPLFSLSSLVPSTVILGIGAFPLGVNGNTITISAISSGILISTILKFNLSVIGPPSTNQPASIRVSVQTSAGYFRDQQTLSYSASPGQLAATMTCLTYEIGYATSCTLQLTTASKIPNNGVIAILFSNIFNMLDTNSPCRLSGTGLNLLGTCITFGSNNTLLVTGLTPAGSSSQIQPQTLTVTFSLTIPSSIGSFTLSLQTLSPVWTIDQTTLSISSSPRKLLSPELAISSSSTITYSPTVYTLVFSLPLTLPLTYTIQCALPFDVQIGRTILISNAIMVNFVGGTLTMTSLSLTAGYSITIANLMTYQSRQPIPISVTISSNSNIYFKGSLTLTMTTAKQLDSITFIQSSSMVYSNNLGNIVASGLSNGDMILLTANYTGFYPSAQPDCTFLIAKCGNNGLITIVQAGNLDGVTSFVLNLFNPPYVGQSTLSLIVYDSQRAYEKQRGTLTLTTSIPNQMRAMLTQSNPYYLEPSVYAFSLSLTTPSATRLNILVPATYTITTVTCVLNCIVLSTTANSIVLSVSSSNIAVNVQVTNPDAFADWTFTSSSALGDMDYATVSPKLVCVAPCRSCSSNYSQCLTCYPWQSNNKLSNYNCLATCPNQYYPLLSGLYYVCTACNSFCLSCSNNPDNCSSCVSPFILFGQSCLQQCPTTYYLDSTTCRSCSANCLICTALLCSSCNDATYLLAGSCVDHCPTGTYTSSRACAVCPVHCIVCSTDSGTCLTCNSTYFLYLGACWSDCPANVYQQLTTFTCVSCQLPCQKCSITSTNCTACNPLNSVIYYYLNNHCYQNCPATYYANISSQTCLPCKSPCYTCTFNGCIACIHGYYYMANNCYDICPIGTYPSAVSAVNVCSTCPTECTNCASATVCLACLSRYYLYRSSCVQSCPDTYFINTDTGSCAACSYPCYLCKANGCLTCSTQTTLYLFSLQCVPNCAVPLHPNNATMVCEACVSPCKECTWSNECVSCVSSYYLSGNKCLSSCPVGYYGQDSTCKICPATCQTCLVDTATVNCLTCIANYYSYGYSCLSSCPTNTILDTPYCLSSNCSISFCVRCTATRCLGCTALYSLNSNNNTCTLSATSSAFLSAIANVPVPFPFLIAMVLVIILTVLLKLHFKKMYTPLLIYSVGGLLQVGSLLLWTILSVLWNLNMTASFPVVSIVNAPVLILAVYMLLNTLSAIFWARIMRHDRKYAMWENQDNKSSSFSIAVISFVFSYRFELICFSKLVHAQCFSATLSTTSTFLPSRVFAGLSFLVAISAIVVSCYITYLQTSLNYLFFSGIEVALVAVIMIVITILVIITPKNDLVEQRTEYEHGFDQDRIEGNSIQILMPAIEEEHHYHQEIGEDQGAFRELKQQFIEHSSSDKSLYSLSQQDRSEGKEDQREVRAKFLSAIIPEDYGPELNTVPVFELPHSETKSGNIIFDDDSQALEPSKKYMGSQTITEPLFNRVAGSIVKQNLFELKEEEESSAEEEFEQYEIDYGLGQWQPSQNHMKGQIIAGKQSILPTNWSNNQYQNKHSDKRKSLKVPGKLTKTRVQQHKEIDDKITRMLQKDKSVSLGSDLIKLQQELKEKQKIALQEELQQAQKLASKLKLQQEMENLLNQKMYILSQEERELRAKQIELAREKMERRMMGIQDRMTRLAATSARRSQMDAKRKARMKQIEANRRLAEERPLKLQARSNEKQKPVQTVQIMVMTQTEEQQDISKKTKPSKSQPIVLEVKDREWKSQSGRQYETSEHSLNRITAISPEKSLQKEDPIYIFEEQDYEPVIEHVTEQDKVQQLGHQVKSIMNAYRQREMIASAGSSAQLTKHVANRQSSLDNYQSLQFTPSMHILAHWPVEPELEDKIDQIRRKADMYIQRKRPRVAKQTAKQQEEWDQQTSKAQQFIYEEESVTQQSPLPSAATLKIPLGRVNRKIISLAPR